MFAILRRQALRQRKCLLPVRRLQHDGPHKEYFQNPAQLPGSAFPQYTPPSQPTFPAQPSILNRILRSTLWATVFGVLGVTAGAGAITWEYLQPQFELGSEEELEMLEEIKEMMSTHPLLDVFAQDPNWKEQEMYMQDRDWDQDRDFHFLSRKTLKGANGISMAFFTNTAHGMACLMFLPGPGVEGWPDVVHGGIISSLLQEAMEQTASLYHSPAFGKERAVIDGIEINFRVPLQPGNVYIVLAYVGFAEMDVDGGMGTPLGSPQRMTSNVRAVLVETDSLDWEGKEHAVIVHAEAAGRLKDPVWMSQEDYESGTGEASSANEPS